MPEPIIILAVKYTDYMLLGYGLAAVLIGGLIASIWWRYQLLRKDETLLEQLEQEGPAEAHSTSEHAPPQPGQASPGTSDRQPTTP
ncbi:MAG: heme exporter protein CcmD [Chloroflexi bacterium]|nr:heme exporter protein CcmD [Chloroflexota bacterium]